MEVGGLVVLVEHRYDDPKEAADFRHRNILSQVRVGGASQPLVARTPRARGPRLSIVNRGRTADLQNRSALGYSEKLMMMPSIRLSRPVTLPKWGAAVV